MTKKEKARAILDVLEKYIPSVEVPLKHNDPFTLLIAVLLSAQCTDERVNQVTPKLFALADDPFEMSKLSIAKSKAIVNTSKILVEKYKGKVPSQMHLLEELPGVGHKTASVVMCQAFNVPAFPVDTHIHRLAYRWGLSDGSSVKKTEQDLKALIPEERWIKAHLQIILFARKYCPARGHVAADCPVCKDYGVKGR
jgi:endonuclease-3